MTKIKQSDLQSYYTAFSALVGAMRDAKARYDVVIPGGFRSFYGHSVFIKQLMSLPHTQDYSIFEAQLKRRVLKVCHRVNGHKDMAGRGIAYHLPSVYQDTVAKYQQAGITILKKLADVDIKTAQAQLEKVADVIAKSK